MKTVFDPRQVQAKTAKPATLRTVIRDELLHEDGECYSKIERLLMPPGVSGSRQFDQAYAVGALLEHDAEHGGRIAIYMENTGASRRLIWDHLQKTLREIGFKMRHGRLVGLIEDLSAKEETENGDIGQPDID